MLVSMSRTRILEALQQLLSLLLRWFNMLQTQLHTSQGITK